MKRVVTETRCVLDPSTLDPRCCGISQHRGVLILWDEDFDVRIITAVDMMDDLDRLQLFAAYEHKGVVDLYWRSYVPPKYAKLDMFLDNDGVIENHIVTVTGAVYA